ncbi:SCO6745 family protein [Actinokineospora iranica]|uniref:SalK n=1 Tax=Actinokineospora iranica TaxID=1271860 RepID=A0A1G6U286_9PSEU|nr:hypothetical protein [Actinokineospora iranica]SDD34665.1 hypothetical protein SAMN05216174_11035 [Actinokineospora iranica]
MTTTLARLARLAWHTAEPLHAVLYYAPETAAATARFDLPVGWMTYFGCRAAPMGSVSAATATAVFYNLAPAMVARSVPALWRHATPEQFLDARLTAVDAALRRLLGSHCVTPETARAAELAVAAAAAADGAGRPLGAANAALPSPAEPHLALWQALTTLREYRGDGHVAALTAAEIDPCAAHVLSAATGGAPESSSKRYHKWTDTQWNTARDSLVARGWLTGAGTITASGARARERLEQETDRLARFPYLALGERGCAELIALVHPLSDLVMAAGAVPVPNPVGFCWPPA